MVSYNSVINVYPLLRITDEIDDIGIEKWVELIGEMVLTHGRVVSKTESWEGETRLRPCCWGRQRGSSKG